MQTKFTRDKNGLYWFGNQRMLVSHMRGGVIPQYNPRSENNPYEPTMIKKEYKGPVGCVVAVLIGNEIRYGFSRVNLLEGDRYDRDLSIRVALNRCLYDNIEPPFEGYRPEIKLALEKMFGRCRNYFKYLNK